ncbi:hypothetical protein CROQUDRAFT_106904 [Cronartium quercuum f. sp. fusiforme G11]|uniref:Uncharacterized protein n=1 Tax=Cronartium quercuum f. sp. fusiforme G11 TaxID=708437 RepID=A0A9P6TDH7_9BASI|nr:hypothetical protein CROQUDRAFT_106904 [Cronartium quercuum f. sp. fusiforme G11]
MQPTRGCETFLGTLQTIRSTTKTAPCRTQERENQGSVLRHGKIAGDPRGVPMSKDVVIFKYLKSYTTWSGSHYFSLFPFICIYSTKRGDIYWGSVDTGQFQVSAWSVVGVNLPRGQPGPPWSSPRTSTGWTRAVKKPVGPVRSRLVSYQVSNNSSSPRGRLVSSRRKTRFSSGSRSTAPTLGGSAA